MTIEIYRKGNKKIPAKLKIEHVVQKTLRALSKPQKGSLSIAFVTDSEMRTLNRGWLGRRGTTDVISFPELNEIILNQDIVSSWPDIRRLLVHGILSLYGFDHKGKNAQKMKKLEETILHKV